MLIEVYGQIELDIRVLRSEKIDLAYEIVRAHFNGQLVTILGKLTILWTEK